MNYKFRGKHNLQNALRSIALRDNFQFKIVKSNPKLLIVRCVVDNYQWFLRAFQFGEETNIWIVNKFIQDHIYSREIVLNGHRQATFSIIKEYIKGRISIADTDMMSVKDAISHVRLELGLIINYQKVWRAREFAKNEIKRSPKESYVFNSFLFSYAKREKSKYDSTQLFQLSLYGLYYII